MSKAQRRSKIFVDKQVQGAMVRQLVIHWLIACFVTILYLLILQVFQSGLQEPLSNHLAALWSKYGSLIIVMVTLFPVFIYDSVRVSHRFTGPMVAFRKRLKSLAEGESIAPLRFRGTDFWTDLAAHLNKVAQRLGQFETPQSKSNVTSGS